VKNLFIGLIVIAFLALACGEEEVTGPQEPDRYMPTSPANVLKNVELAFDNRDINLLTAMLSTEFVFYFDPRDVGRNIGGYIIPESWSYDEFRDAAANLFSRAYSINLTIDVGHVGEPAPGKKSYNAPDVKTSLLVMVDDVSGFLGEGFGDYGFEIYRGKTGREFWRLIKWADHRYRGGDASPANKVASVGIILAYYRR
jgi:hypothetical protein